MLEILRRFAPTLKPYRGRMVIGGLLVLLVAAIELTLPWPLQVVVDNVLHGKKPTGVKATLLAPVIDSSIATIAVCAAAIVVLAGLAALLGYISARLLQSVGERLVADLRTQIFDHLQRLSLTFHQGQRVGDLSSRLTGDVAAIQALLVAVFGTVLPNVALLLGIVVVAVFIEPVFAILLLVIAPVFYLVVRHYRGSIKQASSEARLQEGRVSSHVTETLTTIRLVQSFAAERRSLGRFRNHSDARLQAGLRQVDLQARLPAAVEIVAQVGSAGFLLIGAILVLRGQLTVGILFVLLTYLRQIYGPMKALARLTSTISKAQASGERVEDVLRSTVMIKERDGARDAPRLHGYLELRDVSFNYEDGQPVLQNVNLHALPGQMIALAGSTGAGKSTIASLIPRLYDTTTGQVLLDGHDVADLTVASVRSQVAVVPQEPVMISGTIMDNIAYGAPDASHEQLLRAAQAAFVDEFVDRLPEGYDTHVAEGGTSLSGGQRQRIAIARALAADTPIVVLDEPTSGLDAISEALVMRGLAQLTASRTVVVIAHRLSTLRDADAVFVIQQGRVVASGTHEELIHMPGHYCDMYALMMDEHHEEQPAAS